MRADTERGASATDDPAGDAPRIALLTVDLEEPPAHPFTIARRREDPAAAKREAERLLASLGNSGMRATWFVVGDLADRLGDLIRRVAESGHEIASHSDIHSRIDHRDPRELERALRDARAKLEDLSGVAITGFRAPCWSLLRSMPGQAEAVMKAGFTWSSSVYPAATPWHGDGFAPREPWRWPCGLLEIPPSVSVIGPFRAPAAGGAWLRILPESLHVRALSRSAMPMLFLHPWEFARSGRSRRVVERLARKFRFVSVADRLGGIVATANRTP